jgi:flagellar biosynthetic protein FliR
MMVDLPEILGLSQQFLWAIFAVFMRVAALISVVPAFGERSIPARVRFAVAAAFTLVVAPAISPNVASPPQNLLQAVSYLAPEVVAGLFFGLLLRMFVFALQVAGSIAAQSTSLSQIFGGTAGADPQPAMGHVLVTAGLALAALMGLHVQFSLYLIQTYTLAPIGLLLDASIVSQVGLAQVSRVFALGFTLAAPFLLGSLVYNVTLGVINKAMPQLMVSFVGAPAITAGGLLLLFVSAPLMLGAWLEAFQSFVADPGGLSR